MATYYITMTNVLLSFELNLSSPQNAYSFKPLAQRFKAEYDLNGAWKGMSLVVRKHVCRPSRYLIILWSNIDFDMLRIMSFVSSAPQNVIRKLYKNIYP
jgi:hypothetical protein